MVTGEVRGKEYGVGMGLQALRVETRKVHSTLHLVVTGRGGNSRRNAVMVNGGKILTLLCPEEKMRDEFPVAVIT